MTDPTNVLASARTLPIRIFGAALLALALFIGFKGVAAGQTICGGDSEILDTRATGSAQEGHAISSIRRGDPRT